ncbi:hypothetical protein GCM10011415_30600 [Salipiger pallidus]|uniref:NitT/TauT family transport system ATP-binding protein n=1 Tax=Salipiger pallidus TaxID=1775170 RepID=A0A8J2ZM48_9RHOB|nr:hypothetical protein [Salipiger pallidus]GGG79318.1 hypothetical protein GCM10011415_30600 [Salipiger pallidus]
MTVVFVTHDIEEAAFLADELVVLHSRLGRMKDIVPLTLSHPRDPVSPEVSAAARELRRAI